MKERLQKLKQNEKRRKKRRERERVNNVYNCEIRIKTLCPVLLVANFSQQFVFFSPVPDAGRVIFYSNLRRVVLLSKPLYFCLNGPRFL